MPDPFVVNVHPANTQMIEKAVSVAKLAGAVDSDDVILGELLAMGALYSLRIAGQMSSPLSVLST